MKGLTRSSRVCTVRFCPSRVSYIESRWDDETARLRAWLEPVESYEDDFERNYSLHQSGTCEWAFNPSDSTGRTIIQWFDGSDDDHKIVWLTGNPAQGKSVFSAYLIQRCQDIKGRCLYFFCRHDDEAKRSVKKALKTIAFSLSQYEDRIRERYFAQMKQGISLGNIISAAVLAEKLFNAPASILSQPLHCVIDGLDELALADRRDLAKVLPTITALNIRILIISRPDRELEDAFEEKQARVQIICMDQNHTSRDIRSVVTERVGRKLSALPEGSKKTIIDTITRKSGGLFLWAKLAVDIICRKRLEKAIFEALNNLPLESQMKGLYSVIVARISAECSDEDERSLAKALLTWTFCSIRPLLLSELECALYLRFGTINGLRKNVRDLSGSLIQIGEDKQVTVVHATVKEFFMSEDAGEFRVSEPISHHYVAEACLDYILEKLPEFLHAHEDSSPEPLRLRDKYPFIEYATQYLFNHLQQCQLSDCLKDRIIEFLRGRRALTWIEALATFELTKLLSFAGDVVERSGIDERVKTYGSDLRRIALLIDEALITFPRSVHTSLSSTFPDSCAIAREVRNELVIFTKPSFVEWPAAKAARRRSDVWTMGMRSAIAFSPCGDYLIFGQMPESASPIDLTVYETQTYQRVSKIPPFAFNPSVLNKNVLPLGNKFAFFQIRFDASQNVRIVIAFAVGRVILEGKIFSRCIMAEYFSQSTLQSGAWQQKPFDVPLTRGTPAVRVAMNPRGRQIVAWFDRILHLWRSIGSGSLTFDIRYEVLSSDFILVNQDVFAICVTKESVQIYDVGARRLMSDLPYRCTFPVDKAFIDPAGRTALLVSGRRSTRQHSLLQLHIESRRNISLSVEQYLDPGIQHYSGRFGRSAWEYEIWENIKRRTLVARGESAPSQIYPHPFKMESLLQPSISQYAFVVFDDLPSTSIAIAVQHEPTQPVRQESSVDLYFAVLEKAEARDRFCRHPNNCRLSLCGMFFAVLGCDRMYHSPDCVDCVTKPSRLAVINRSSTRPSLRWPLEEGDIDGGGRIDVSFDQFSRLVVFTDHTPGFSVHVVDPFTEFTLRYLGLLRCPDMAIPPLVHTRSHSEMYFACYSRRMPLEIWRWESNPSKESLHLYRELDGVCIIAAVLVSSVLVFISDMGWVGTVPLLDQNARVVNHFLLANEIITPLKDGGKMTCDVDGLVTVDASDGQCWQFTVYSLCQYLQGFE